MPYATGTYDAVGDVQVRVALTTRSLVEGSEVVQAKIGFQSNEATSPLPDPAPGP